VAGGCATEDHASRGAALDEGNVEQCATRVLLLVEARADVGGGGAPRRMGEEQAKAVDQTESRMSGAAGGDRALGVADSSRVQRI